MGMQEPDIRAGALDANQVTSNVIHATKNLTDNIQNGVNRTAQTLQAWQDRDFKAREAHKARQHDEWKFKEQLKTEVENANANRNAQMAKAMSDNITSMRNVDEKNQTDKDITQMNINYNTERDMRSLNHGIEHYFGISGISPEEAFEGEWIEKDGKKIYNIKRGRFGSPIVKQKYAAKAQEFYNRNSYLNSGSGIPSASELTREQ